MAATKTSKKKNTKKSGSKQTAGKTTPSAPRATTKSDIPVNTHPFAPGAKVEVYRAVDVDVQRRENRPPVGDPVTTATVTKAGDLTVQSSKLEVGQYVAVAPLDNPPPGVGNRVKGEDAYGYVTFGKVSEEQREKFGAMTGLHGGKAS